MNAQPRLKDSNPVLRESFRTARACHQAGDLDGAEALYRRLLGMDPGDDQVLFLFGALRADRGDLATGLECLGLARGLNPGNPVIPYTQGVLLQQAGRLEEAQDAYRSCLAAQPDHQAALENLAAACYELDAFQEGLTLARRARRQVPDSRLALRAEANCLTGLGRRSEALAVLEQALRLHPATPSLRIHRAWELMANGRFDEGLREHEWRNLGALAEENNAREVPYPRWAGEPVAGRTLLVYGEAGVGDEVMFAPYVQGLLDAGAHCILECDPRLVALFARALPGCRILPRQSRNAIPWEQRLAEVDWAISSASLPAHVSPPGRQQAFLQPDPALAAAWRERLEALGPGLRVGVSWRGGAHPKAQALRSIPPALFGSLVSKGARFVSLQYGAGADECARVSPALHALDGLDPLTDLDGFAALVSQLDLVISVDNSTVHFAAALGVPTWVLLPRYAEWRWGRHEADAARWYRGLRFFQQGKPGEAGWRKVIARVRKALAEFVPAPRDELPMAPAAPILPPADPSPAPRRALLLGDTQNWYHWGCSCTSLGLHQQLREAFGRIDTLPLSRVLREVPVPVGLADLDDPDFLEGLRRRCPEVVAALEAADTVVVNGEGSIHGTGPAALVLLYLAHAARLHLGRRVHIVNHSCFPGDGRLADGTPAADFYARVYRAVDRVVVRERHSREQLRALGVEAELGFDCLPLFLDGRPSPAPVDTGRRIVFGGSVSWTPELVEAFAGLAQKLAAEGHAIEILSGAKAYLADDEVGFVEAFGRRLRQLQVPFHLQFALSEAQWLRAIAGAALVVSGRFHYSVAAAFQGVPFLVAESNTAKVAGLLEALELDPERVSLAGQGMAELPARAAALLADPALARAAVARLAELRRLARLNASVAASETPGAVGHVARSAT